MIAPQTEGTVSRPHRLQQSAGCLLVKFVFIFNVSHSHQNILGAIYSTHEKPIRWTVHEICVPHLARQTEVIRDHGGVIIFTDIGWCALYFSSAILQSVIPPNQIVPLISPLLPPPLHLIHPITAWVPGPLSLLFPFIKQPVLSFSLLLVSWAPTTNTNTTSAPTSHRLLMTLCSVRLTLPPAEHSAPDLALKSRVAALCKIHAASHERWKNLFKVSNWAKYVHIELD